MYVLTSATAVKPHRVNMSFDISFVVASKENNINLSHMKSTACQNLITHLSLLEFNVKDLLRLES